MIKGPKAGHMVCTHCGASYEINKMLPAEINMVTAVMNEFMKNHKNCKENPNVVRDWEVVQDNG